MEKPAPDWWWHCRHLPTSHDNSSHDSPHDFNDSPYHIYRQTPYHDCVCHSYAILLYCPRHSRGYHDCCYAADPGTRHSLPARWRW